MNKLLIVESPTKARTITRMLGRDFQVLASMGHIRDLPEHTFGVDIEHDFKPEYVDTPRSAKIVRELRAAAKKADEVYLAPDPDREGEAIAWHLEEVLKGVHKKQFHRVTFHEITRNAIEHALENRTAINLDLVDAQQARRVLDRIVGYQVSPLLWSRLEKGISAGRVQSVAVRLVVERERQITSFVPEEYWNLELECLSADNRKFVTRLHKIDGQDFRIASGTECSALVDALQKGSQPLVTSVTRQQRRRNAPPPFTTSTLQQAASNQLHFTANSTMTYAQKLYEGIDLGSAGQAGLITYMRTDSVNIAAEARDAARSFIQENYGREFVPDRPNIFRSKASAQEAHEAIRPTDVRRTPKEMAPYLEPALLKLYTLIWKRFVASQMSPAVQDLTTVDVQIQAADSRNCTFRATATVPVFPGFTTVFNDEAKRKEDESAAAEMLRSLREGEHVKAGRFGTEQKFTEPPPRYTEASLIKELEENGIGRPSTYASIMRTIVQRDYVARTQGKLVPTELGFRVVDFLVKHLPQLFDVGFTAGMEEKLDSVERGELAWTGMMHEFYDQFMPWMEAAKLADAPPASDADALLAKLDKVQFAPAEKRGARTYDDAKFYKSVRDKYQKTNKMTAKQYQSLIALAARYTDQISGAMPENLAKDMHVAAEKAAEQREKAEASAATDTEKAMYDKLFTAFETVEFAAPVVRRGRSYDDKKFFDSLRKQAAAGRKLSEKQMAALSTMVDKYADKIADLAAVRSALGLPAAAETAVSEDTKAEIKSLLDELSQVEGWAEPVKRGRFTFNDKDFYESLRGQFYNGKQLSPKQIAALQKLAAKYRTE